MTRRPLAQTLVELVDSVVPNPDEVDWLRVSEVAVDLPIEVAVVAGDGGVEVLANPLRWRWCTSFDPQPGRLSFRCREEVPG